MPGIRPTPPVWRKSTESTFGGCVEVCVLDGAVRVRNSRFPRQTELVFTMREWVAFLAGVRKNEFDLSRLSAG